MPKLDFHIPNEHPHCEARLIAFTLNYRPAVLIRMDNDGPLLFVGSDDVVDRLTVEVNDGEAAFGPVAWVSVAR
ncbi:hypothetical protein [Allomesorhizobium alhagi]|nr:hypothetical protein [Mesorhizobium alhagi]